MNNELQKALAEFVKTATSGLQQGKDFVVAQAPDVIQQLLRWHLWLAVSSCLVDLVGIIVTTLVMKFAVRKALEEIRKAKAEKNNFADKHIGWIFIGVFSGVFLFTFMCELLFSSLPEAMKIYLAPKVWLIEWALNQVGR